jgi:hypothetical protein
MRGLETLQDGNVLDSCLHRRIKQSFKIATSSVHLHLYRGSSSVDFMRITGRMHRRVQWSNVSSISDAKEQMLPNVWDETECRGQETAMTFDRQSMKEWFLIVIVSLFR